MTPASTGAAGADPKPGERWTFRYRDTVCVIESSNAGETIVAHNESDGARMEFSRAFAAALMQRVDQ